MLSLYIHGFIIIGIQWFWIKFVDLVHGTAIDTKIRQR